MDPHEVQLNQAQQITRTMTLVEEMHTRLFGNGQPGMLDKIDKRLNEGEDRLDKLEHTKSYFKGAGYVVGAVLTFVGWPHVRDLFVHK